MSDIDRVFARLGGGQGAPSEQQEFRRVQRKAGAGSRVVEVVRLPARDVMPRQQPTQRQDTRVRALSWDDGFPARDAPPPAPEAEPAKAPVREQVRHVIPTWTRLRPKPEPEPSPVAPADAAQVAVQPRAKRTQRKPEATIRRAADPFDPTDDGANRYRCEYLIEPTRERRGLMTCAGCR
ncbi:hypothetical protein [Falsiroseomonas sp. HW251]|uniref:hypothetical protein n=1 Tax=Falsiroseomonas sp. HW251 TaxID=3390998 RepID=UPI003D31792E